MLAAVANKDEKRRDGDIGNIQKSPQVRHAVELTNCR
jgi:hypothetical protein